ncbi:hypothetical protein A2U01_0000777 [Trifolium medium]|uniref:Uncharacterized protein n=1 Tax=Trifolium medium TaxID=97028 RepID=A0A392LYM6_9FABA|nr:hypothetical protein [Trifolium medium]
MLGNILGILSVTIKEGKGSVGEVTATTLTAEAVTDLDGFVELVEHWEPTQQLWGPRYYYLLGDLNAQPRHHHLASPNRLSPPSATVKQVSLPLFLTPFEFLLTTPWFHHLTPLRIELHTYSLHVP